jgi:hypothetical protein
VSELELVWGEDRCVCASPSLGFLKDLAQRLACLLCRLAPRKDADIVDVACRHGVWRLIAFVYQVGVVEEVEGR